MAVGTEKGKLIYQGLYERVPNPYITDDELPRLRPSEQIRREWTGDPDDPDYTVELNESAFQEHPEWKEQYRGKVIALHDGKIIDSDVDHDVLTQRVWNLQTDENQFRAYIIRVGEPILMARGPSRLRMRRSNPQE